MELNGRPVTPDELSALGLYNYGHLTSMRVEEGGQVCGLSLRLDRLLHDCRTLHGVDLDLVRRFTRRAVTAATLPRIVHRVRSGARPGPSGADAHLGILVSNRPTSTGALPPLKGERASAGSVTDLDGPVRAR
ncbi:hypothetical protein [Planomonospora venezuelensis]|uniref:Uncharacterized protein n=1 Tax=Planomonospora venezuelensis TaxID=1999 RepID=A0A841D9R7_PLAVE|nr:hypothetical protein [Planomonospora venezuelensis]MBB5965377.1 hypothetical protein [Planomonospora venezuelensis]